MKYIIGLIAVLLLVGCAAEEVKQVELPEQEVVKELESNFITEDEVAKHNTYEDCWVAYQGAVYDISDYIRVHPGGASDLQNLCGETSLFEEQFFEQHAMTKVDVLVKEGEYKGVLK